MPSSGKDVASNGITQNKTEAAWALIATLDWADKAKPAFDNDPEGFVANLQLKMPELYNKAQAALAGDEQDPKELLAFKPQARKVPDTKAQAALAGGEQDPKAGGKELLAFKPQAQKVPVRDRGEGGCLAARQLVVTTCFALGSLGQAIAGSQLVAEFLTLVKDELARPELSWPRSTGTHAPYPPDLLALASVSACTKPGVPQEARIQIETPPQMATDRNTIILLCLALGRWESPGSGQHEEGDTVPAILKQMIALQEKDIRRKREQGFGPRGEEDYERRVLPKLFAGDASSVYQIGSTANL